MLGGEDGSGGQLCDKSSNHRQQFRDISLQRIEQDAEVDSRIVMHKLMAKARHVLPRHFRMRSAIRIGNVVRSLPKNDEIIHDGS